MAKSARTERLVSFVAALKEQEYPSARQFAAAAGVCRKTVLRDIAYLRCHLAAPVGYNETEYGYFLRDPSWVLPFDELQGHSVWALLLCGQVSSSFLPRHLQLQASEALKAQAAVAELDGLETDGLRAFVAATGARAPADREVFDAVCTACRERRRLRLDYCSGSGQTTRRDVDVHALFLADGAWYARAYCHLRAALRSLALHRIESAQLMKRRFKRSTAVVDAVRAGYVFDYEPVQDVVIHGSAEKAGLLSEREWFYGQQKTRLPDGGIELRYPQAPAEELVWWVLSYAGHLQVVAPDQLRTRVREAAEMVVAGHEGNVSGEAGNEGRLTSRL